MTTNSLARVAAGYDQERIALIRQQVAPDATPNELEFFIEQCMRTGLDPLLRQIYFVKRQDDRGGAKGTIQVGIDGCRLIADRTRQYAGSDEAQYGLTEEASYGQHTYQRPTSASVTVWKLVGGHRCPFTATARWGEFYPGDKQGFMWRRMPFHMLAKVAEALALRKAFPQDLSGLYTHEEMDQAGGPSIQVERAEDAEGTVYGRRAPDEPEPPTPIRSEPDPPALDEPQWQAEVQQVTQAVRAERLADESQLRALRAHLGRTGQAEPPDMVLWTPERAKEELSRLSRMPNKA